MSDTQHVLHLTVDDFDKALADAGDKPVFVDFFAPWCGPCRMAAPVIDQLGAEYAGKAVIAKVDIDTNRAISDRYEVRSIPTVIVFKNGKPVINEVGFPGKPKYVEMLNKVLAS